MPPNNHNGSSSSNRRHAEDEEDKRRHHQGESSSPQPSPPPASTSHRLLSNPHRIPIHLLMAGWNRLESVPRWMMERTLGFVVPAVAHHHNHHHHNNSSSTARRVLEQHQEFDMEMLKQKYAKEIKANSEIQGLQKQVRAMKQQLQQQRAQREKLEKKQAAWREKEQKQLESNNAKLQSALEQAIQSSNSKSTRAKEYNKALARAGTKKHERGPKSSGAVSVVHTLSKAAVAAATSPMTLAATGTSSSSTPPMTPEEKEAVALETTILRTWHQTMMCQNQCEIAETYSRQVTSALKRERAILDTQQAEVTVMQMVLDGTQRALQDLYPEVVLRQEDLVERIWERQQLQKQQYRHHHPNSSSTTPPQPEKARSLPRLIANKRPSTRSDGVSDLGESILGFAESVTDGSSVGEEPFHHQCHQKMYNHNGGPTRPPVFTTVEALQQHTLQHMAGVESF